MARRPVDSPYVITTQFGVQDSNAFFKRHSGVDYGVGRNREIKAPTAGQIVYLTFNATGGNMVIIFDGRFYHRLMHNTSFAAGLKVNHTVSEGQVVAYAGDTGLAFGVHCHWDIMDEIISSANPRPTSFEHFKDPSIWLAGGYEPVKPPTETGGIILNEGQVKQQYRVGVHREGDAGGVKNYTGKSLDFMQADMMSAQEWLNQNHILLVAYPEAQNALAARDAIINQLRAELQNSSGSSKEEMQKLIDQIGTLTAKASEDQKKYEEKVKELEEERKKKSEDSELLDNAGNWITKLFNRLFKKG